MRRALRSRLDRPGPSAAPRRSKAALQERPPSPVPQSCTLKYASGEVDTNADSGALYPGGSFQYFCDSVRELEFLPIPTGDHEAAIYRGQTFL